MIIINYENQMQYKEGKGDKEKVKVLRRRQQNRMWYIQQYVVRLSNSKLSYVYTELVLFYNTFFIL